MASITIRNLDDEVKQRLRVRAAEHGNSMEQEARDILAAAVARPEAGEDVVRRARARAAAGEGPQTGEELYRAIRARFAAIGFVEPDELKIPPREPMRDPPQFD